MSEIGRDARDPEDAKAWFYLDHRDDIEAWKALRPDARELLDKHLVGLDTQVEELAEELGVEPATEQLEAGSWPRAGLRRPTWQHRGMGDVGVVIEWERARLLTPGSNEWPYVAVRRVGEGADDGLRQRFNEAMKPIRARLGGKASRNFPFWRYVSSEAPVDPQAIVSQCLTELRELWDASAPVIDDLASGRH